MLAPLCAAALLCGTASSAQASSAAERPSSTGRPSVLLVFVDAGESQLAAVDGMSVGIMSATQGQYSSAQFLLDVTQGARIASSAYDSASPPRLALEAGGGGGEVGGSSVNDGSGTRGTSGNSRPGGGIAGWTAAQRRAEAAPQLLRPGLLAGEIPGGGAYAGILGTQTVDAVAAANTHGHIAKVSIGMAPTLLARIAALRREARLVVADLPAGAEGLADLRALSASREPGELLLAVQRVPDAHGGELLWMGAAGLSGEGAAGHASAGTSGPSQPGATASGMELISPSTNQRGLVAAVDIAPTILAHLSATPIPSDMRGRALETDGTLHSASLRALMARLHVVGGRRLRALGILLLAWALLLLACAVGPLAARPRARARAMRAGAIGVLWAPVVVLLPAALEPSAPVEYATIAVGCLIAGALTDLIAPWPRATIPPAVVAIVLLTLDALSGRQLLMRSVLGPNPILGARFYGIGNELKSALAVLVLAAVAGLLYPAVRGRRAALAVAGAGVVLAIVEGSARIGAGVGGVILVSAGFAVATVMLLPGAVSRRRALTVIFAPIAALVALAAIDLATAHGGGHFTGSILHARSAGDLRDVIVRRYGAAWNELKNHTMPIATGLSLICAVVAVRARHRLLAPVQGDPGWEAALSGGLAAGVVGALAEDSGPVLLVVAVFTLGCVATYLWSEPATRRSRESARSAGRRRAPRVQPGPSDPGDARPVA